MRYIGSKASLLEAIEAVVRVHIPEGFSTFFDPFGGTNVVSRHFKKNSQVMTNDLMYFSFVNAKATIESNGRDHFRLIQDYGVPYPLDYLQDLADRSVLVEKTGYYEENYSPTSGAMYFTVDNAKRIDAIREQIDFWDSKGLLSEADYYYLVACLVEAIPSISNTTGTYGAFLKYWDPRALKPLVLTPLEVFDNGKINCAFNEDAVELVKTVSADLVYIDTPYNSRQYASNYHVLENVARNEHPPLKGKTRLFDWTSLKSDFSVERKAKDVMTELVSGLRASHGILSYNNEGIIPEELLIDIVKEFSVPGSCSVTRIPYRKYQSKISSQQKDLHELLIYFRPRKQPREQVTITKRGQEKTNSAMKSVGADENLTLVKSPLNYVGGKFKLLPQILPLFPSSIDTFVDLFCGGANVGINVQATQYILNDMNSRVIEMFKYFMSRPADQLVNEIKQRIEESGLSKTNEEAFLRFRKQYNHSPNPLDLYVLSSYSYNYQFRFNNQLQFNNPFGRNRSRFSPNMERNLVTFVDRAQRMNLSFTNDYFQEVDLSGLGSNDFVYLDPPYLITTGSYNDGNRGFRNWSVDQELEMYALMDRLTEQGVKWALSNVLVHKGKEHRLLGEFVEASSAHVHELQFGYSNSSYNSKKLGSIEVLVTNYRPVAS